ncbi:MAG: hypothetical protein ACKERG_01215 [Candidatus Hodgkinia cicadicola]
MTSIENRLSASSKPQLLLTTLKPRLAKCKSMRSVRTDELVLPTAATRLVLTSWITCWRFSSVSFIRAYGTCGNNSRRDVGVGRGRKWAVLLAGDAGIKGVRRVVVLRLAAVLRRVRRTFVTCT